MALEFAVAVNELEEQIEILKRNQFLNDKLQSRVFKAHHNNQARTR